MGCGKNTLYSQKSVFYVFYLDETVYTLLLELRMDQNCQLY